MSDAIESQAFEGWAILELMGHRRLGGYVKQVEMFGTALCRIDVPGVNGDPGATQFYSAAALYCVTPTTEDLARRVAAQFKPEPIQAFQLPKPTPFASQRQGTFYGEREDDDHDAGRDFE